MVGLLGWAAWLVPSAKVWFKGPGKKTGLLQECPAMIKGSPQETSKWQTRSSLWFQCRAFSATAVHSSPWFPFLRSDFLCDGLTIPTDSATGCSWDPNFSQKGLLEIHLQKKGVPYMLSWKLLESDLPWTSWCQLLEFNMAHQVKLHQAILTAPKDVSRRCETPVLRQRWEWRELKRVDINMRQQYASIVHSCRSLHDWELQTVQRLWSTCLIRFNLQALCL